MPSIQIFNDGASIRVVTDGVAKFVTKDDVQEIVVVKNTIVKVDTGRGALRNTFINHPDVTIPLAPSPEALRDIINAMLQTTDVVEILYVEPLMIDESEPHTIYKGYALPGTTPNQSLWAIMRSTIFQEITTNKWANGNKDFVNIWDNRTTLNYL